MAVRLRKDAWGACYKSLEDQLAENDARMKRGERPRVISAPTPGNTRGNRDASWLYNGKLHPVVPYAIRGAVWNQGWTNARGGLNDYHDLHKMIRGWRLVWDRPELPVYHHQFHAFPGSSVKPAIGGASEMRLGSWMARDIPNAGMASQIDIGGYAHCKWKTVPGLRLALHALKNQYGRKKVVAEGSQDLKTWMPHTALAHAPSLSEDYRIVGSSCPGTPHDDVGVRGYIDAWKKLWDEDVPAEIKGNATAIEGGDWTPIAKLLV